MRTVVQLYYIQKKNKKKKQLRARLEKVTLCMRLYVPKHRMMRAAVALATSVQLGTPCNRTVFQGTLQVSLLLHENNTASTLRAQTLVVAKMMPFYFFFLLFRFLCVTTSNVSFEGCGCAIPDIASASCLYYIAWKDTDG